MSNVDLDAVQGNLLPATEKRQIKTSIISALDNLLFHTAPFPRLNYSFAALFNKALFILSLGF